MKKPSKYEKYAAAIVATVGCLVIAAGMYMIMNEKVSVGLHPRTLQHNVIGGPLVAFFGSVFIFIAWLMVRQLKD